MKSVLDSFIADLEVAARDIGTLTVERKENLLHRAAAALRSGDVVPAGGRTSGRLPWKLMQLRRMGGNASNRLIAFNLRRAAAWLRHQEEE
ncbi:hypothetical protein QN224_16155 [Sinorhizobium sp. 8-89]|uniref:hypothetical protein n=1 Tax=Sinorhizobium sp. 7-81 TaxID=3049087 RepID=UPI0024C24413|nr:hypothetical protein [Sinorhizobium sp. 7-81]MDK1386943.1 hypothetical protein [Sinorhizobium sp. 7-81]